MNGTLEFLFEGCNVKVCSMGSYLCVLSWNPVVLSVWSLYFDYCSFSLLAIFPRLLFNIHPSSSMGFTYIQLLSLHALVTTLLGYGSLVLLGFGYIGIFSSSFRNLWSIRALVVLLYGLWSKKSSLCVGFNALLGQLCISFNSKTLSYPSAFVVCVALMDYKEARGFQRGFKRHEESIQRNRTSLFLVTSKVHENEHKCTSQNATIMNALVQ